ncbi:heparin lyase I family protein [Croceitalea vernalis]|uniref:Heparin lyase I family protein n=1 Tax=Croceitalea vernalis TaxID=3075599 RepID=A0ABU3BGE6_9FLAO|nr:heparin lyase I family protein [Croceitalea sp. P007]MDT0621244.1 heparin lyase I family protein [Croceitalea sp. P007]
MKNSIQLILKKVAVLVLVFTALLSLSFCSSQEDEQPTTFVPTNTDISVTTSESLLIWIDGNDLIQKLENSISYNYGDASQSQTEKSLVISSDSTSAIASINFKQEFSNLFSDTNVANNSVTISLEKEIIQNNAVILKADGPGNTYDLITSVLAPGNNPIEVPDCNHSEFGNHIDEVFDSELNDNIFRFYIHTTPDNDRCLNFDRQRNEIKTYDKSPDNLLGIENETVVYTWLFKLPEGFQSSPNFTHLHQLKSVGGDFSSMPMYTLTTRKGSPDRLELRYAETDTQITLKQTDLATLIDVWLEVTETISYGASGTYAISIKKVIDGTVLFEYANNDIINWRPEGSFVRPKWGIYRSLLNAQDLRDETILFANFSVEEL